MNFLQTRAQVNDRPSTFQPPGNPFAQLVDAVAWALAVGTEGIDDIMASLLLGQSVYGWLDVLGLLFGVPRNPNESDVLYEPRIVQTLAAWVGTVPAIEIWGILRLGGNVVVTENFTYANGVSTGSVGYSLAFPAGVSSAQIQDFINGLARIRPAGVPFTISQRTGGLYLDTINYMGEALVMGAFLSSNTTVAAATIPSATISAQPLLPGEYFTDPTLNPGL